MNAAKADMSEKIRVWVNKGMLKAEKNNRTTIIEDRRCFMFYPFGSFIQRPIGIQNLPAGRGTGNPLALAAHLSFYRARSQFHFPGRFFKFTSSGTGSDKLTNKR